MPIASTGDLTNDWWNPETKTIYDPCPNGYRIPKNGTYGAGSQVTNHPDWSIWQSSGLTAGRIFKEVSFFPANGRRTYDTGALQYISTEGFRWTSTTSRIDTSINLWLNSTSITTDNPRSRANATSTRCIAE